VADIVSASLILWSMALDVVDLGFELARVEMFCKDVELKDHACWHCASWFN
jgi:hypothetical protein